MREIDQQLLSRTLASVRRHMPAHAWSEYADAIVADRRAREGHLRKPDEEVDRSLLAELPAFQSTGVLQLPQGAPVELAESIRHHLEALAVHKGPHVFSKVGGTPRPLNEIQQTSQFAGYTADQLLRVPGLVDLVNRPDIIDFIESYLGCVPTLYSLNAWWSFPARAPGFVNVQYFHRDTDDWRFCALFLYLTDVDVQAGPHQVIAGSHTVAGMERLLDRARQNKHEVNGFDPAGSFVNSMGAEFSAQCEQYFDDAIVNVMGPAGTMFLVNTVALHRGLVPSVAPRLMLWARFGLGPNTNSADLEQGPLCRRQIGAELKDSPRNRYINRLLFEFDRGPI